MSKTPIVKLKIKLGFLFNHPYFPQEQSAENNGSPPLRARQTENLQLEF